MKLSVFTPNTFHQLKDVWEQLENGPDMTIFQTYRWYEWLNGTYQKEHLKNLFRSWIYLYVSDGDKPLLIAPLQISRHYSLLSGGKLSAKACLAGKSDYSDYLNFIYKDFSNDAFSLIFDYLKENGIKNIVFDKLKQNSCLFEFLTNNYPHQELRTSQCVALDLPTTFEEYKKKLSKNFRQNMRTAINRQIKNGFAFTHEISFEISQDTIEHLMKIRQQRLGEKQRKAVQKPASKIYLFLRNIFCNIFDAKQSIFDTPCNAWCFTVKAKKKIIAFYWGLYDSHKKIYYVILAGVDKEYMWYSPAISHFYLFIEELYKQPISIQTFDFLRGSEKYKFDLGGQSIIIKTLKIYL